MRAEHMLCAALMIVFVGCALTACGGTDTEDEQAGVFLSEDEHVMMVKGGSPESYPDKTYGEAFDAFFGTPAWRYFEGSSEDPAELFDVVEFTGYCTYQDVEVKALIQFTLDGESGAFEATYLSFNEVPQSMLMLSALLETVFTDNDIAAGTADAPDAGDSTGTSVPPDTAGTSDGPEPDEAENPGAAYADAPFAGEFEMLSEFDNMGADLSIYVIRGRDIYVEGYAYFRDHVGEVSGEAQVAEWDHFTVSQDENCLDIFYDENTDTLTVEETGIFGGMGVTFAWTYVRSHSTP